jgi:hypothetical protein
MPFQRTTGGGASPIKLAARAHPTAVHAVPDVQQTSLRPASDTWVRA